MPTRFDLDLMQPPTPQAAVDAALLQRLRTWCEAGAPPPLAQPLAAACIASAEGLDGAACALDGSHALARLGRWQGLAWRLRILLGDLAPGHGARPGHPWDCGWWRAGALAAAAAFRPRRATLLLLRPADQAASAELLATLQAQSPAYTRPLRVLLVAGQPLPGVPRLP